MYSDIPLLIIFFQCCGIAAAIHAILNVRTSQSAIAWTLSLVLIPYITLIPYLLFGRSRLTHDKEAQPFDHPNYVHHSPYRYKHKRPRPTWQPEIDFAEHTVTPYDQRMQIFSQLANMPWLNHNQVELLINGRQTFDEIFKAIAQAQKLVVVQSFTIYDDEIGQTLQRLLCERAAAGVAIYFLYDRIGSHKLSRRYLATLRQAGVHTETFSTGRHFRNPLQINFRNHRKLTIVDGEIAFLGGLNIGGPYIDMHPRLCPWRDTHIKVKGPIVDSLQIAFARDWLWMTQTLPLMLFKKHEHIGSMHCQILPSGPADNLETCLLFFVAAINAAQERIWLASPYFIPDDAIRTALQLAVLRGVDVRLLVPSCADHFTVFAASNLYAYEMAQAGVKVYRYQPGFMHQKVVLIDQDTSAIGSANLDNRSFRLNFELTLITVDKKFAQQVEAMLEADFLQSIRISNREYRHASFFKKLTMHLAKLFSPIL